MANARKELLIDFIWIHKSEILERCVSTTGVSIHISDFGYKNQHFKDANYCGVTFQIESNIYKGAVKFFETSLDWVLWSSSNRSEAKDVSLVVVTNHDYNSKGTFEVPIVVVDIPIELMECYTSLLEHGHVYCTSHFNTYDSLRRHSYLTRMLIDRLELKFNYIQKIYTEHKNDPTTTVIYLLFDTLLIGTRNRSNMVELFKSLNNGKVFMHLSTQDQYDAVIIGAAGLLNDRYAADEHIWNMRKDFKRLETHFGLKPMSSSHWHFSRTNPSYTLWVQLAQLSAILFHNKDLVFKFVYANSLEAIHDVLKSPISTYWQEHHSPALANNATVKCMPIGKREIMIINAIVPYLFFYNKINTYNDETEYIDILLEYLHNTKAESHKYTRKWSSNDVVIESAFESQAFTQICKVFCDEKLCSECNIGIGILRKTLPIL